MSSKEYIYYLVINGFLIACGVLCQYYDPVKFFKFMGYETDINLKNTGWIKDKIKLFGKLMILVNIIFTIVVTRNFFG